MAIFHKQHQSLVKYLDQYKTFLKYRQITCKVKTIKQLLYIFISIHIYLVLSFVFEYSLSMTPDDLQISYFQVEAIK